MKLLMFDFECEQGHQTEELVKSNVHEIDCPKCDKKAYRLIAAVRSDWRRMGLDPGFPGASAKWEKMQTKKAQKEDSVNLTHY